MRITEFDYASSKSQLEPKLREEGISWSGYIRHKYNSLRKLEDKGHIIWPKKFSATDIYNLTDETLVLSGELFPEMNRRRMAKKELLMPVRFRGKDLKTQFYEQIRRADQPFVGWDFFSEGKYKVVTLYDMIRAQVAKDYVNPEITMYDYDRSDATAVIRGMPSFSEDKVYDDFNIRHIVLNSENAGDTFRLDSNHNCRRGTYSAVKFGRKFMMFGKYPIPSGRKGEERLLDHHVLAAFKKIPGKYDPFIRARPDTLRFFNNCHNNVLVEEKYLRPLRRVETEWLLWMFVGEQNRAKGNI